RPTTPSIQKAKGIAQRGIATPSGFVDVFCAGVETGAVLAVTMTRGVALAGCAILAGAGVATGM
ncbi:MAG TPA: hypothetical protein VE986_02970, partial [Hyphomicrobiales bacterium]|nr:hypothetical protein [Hyphomicrobiales bacterium]